METNIENVDLAEDKDIKPIETENSSQQNYHEGENLRFVKVRFPGHAKSFAFHIGTRKLRYGQKVVAMSDRGMAVGYINSFPYDVPFTKEMLPIKSISKIATQEDVDKERETYKRQKEAEVTCQNLIEKHNLNMNLTHVEFTQFGKKVVFYFVAPARVDFRGLVKDLVGELKLRIELRQISVRDRSASMGAIGPCGRELCCSSFLSRYGHVSMKMARNQNLGLNASKLNGVCGQIKCCVEYEDDIYSTKRKKLPKEGIMALLQNGDKGQVKKLHLIKDQFDVLTQTGAIKRYTADQFVKPLNDYKLPHLDHIHDETQNVIGLAEKEQKKQHFMQKELSRIEEKAKSFAIETIGEYRQESEVLQKYAKELESIVEEEALIETPSTEKTYIERPKEESPQENAPIVEKENSKQQHAKQENSSRRPYKKKYSNRNSSTNRKRYPNNSNKKNKPS